MLFAAATDHRYLSSGHVLDFTNKALEALDIAGWEGLSPRACSPRSRGATPTRSGWRSPTPGGGRIDLVPAEILLEACVPRDSGCVRAGR